MSLAEHLVMEVRVGEPPSLEPSSGLGLLAASRETGWRNHPGGSLSLASVSCEDCGAQRIESGPRCENCEHELGGECGP
jgi:hypothetical protein